MATIKAQLGEVGFTRSKAEGAGDCYPLSVMAGFEITAKAAREPTAVTTASVREMREGSIGLLAGDDPIDGIAVAFREYHPTPRARFRCIALLAAMAMALLLVRRAR